VGGRHSFAPSSGRKWLISTLTQGWTKASSVFSSSHSDGSRLQVCGKWAAAGEDGLTETAASRSEEGVSSTRRCSDKVVETKFLSFDWPILPANLAQQCKATRARLLPAGRHKLWGADSGNPYYLGIFDELPRVVKPRSYFKFLAMATKSFQ
jgi:hypothetical protein